MSAIGGLFNMVGSIAQGSMNKQAQESANATNIELTRMNNAANLEATQATNAANIQIAESTNAANQEIADKTNAFNAAQADLAYQRSTSSSKVGELIAAGMSPQQARQIVASQGLTGSPSPATGTSIPAQGATMQSPHFQAAQVSPVMMDGLAQGLGSIGAGLDSMFSTYLKSFESPDGGFIGTMLSNDVYEKISSHVGEIDPTALSSPHAFQAWLGKQSDNDWATLRDSEEFSKMWKHPLARRSFLYQINSTYKDSASVQNNLLLQQIEVRRAGLQEKADSLKNDWTTQQIDNEIKRGLILDAQVGIEQNNLARSLLVLDRDVQTANLVTQAQISQLVNSIGNLELQNRLISDPSYREAYFNSMLQNQFASLWMNSYSAMMAEGRVEFLKNNPDDKLALNMFTLLDECGFSATQLCQDLQMNYLAGGNIGDFITKRFSGQQTGSFANMYQSLGWLWQYQKNAEFEAGSAQRLYDTSLEVGMKLLDVGGNVVANFLKPAPTITLPKPKIGYNYPPTNTRPQRRQGGSGSKW